MLVIILSSTDLICDMGPAKMEKYSLLVIVYKRNTILMQI